MHFLHQVVDWLSTGDNWFGSATASCTTCASISRCRRPSLLVAVMIALPIGLALGTLPPGGAIAINVANAGRALPTYAVLVLAVTVFGISSPRPLAWTGSAATFVALVLLGIPPILTNAYVGMIEVDRDLVDAARGVGMRGFRSSTGVELPVTPSRSGDGGGYARLRWSSSRPPRSRRGPVTTPSVRRSTSGSRCATTCRSSRARSSSPRSRCSSRPVSPGHNTSSCRRGSRSRIAPAAVSAAPGSRVDLGSPTPGESPVGRSDGCRCRETYMQSKPRQRRSGLARRDDLVSIVLLAGACASSKSKGGGTGAPAAVQHGRRRPKGLPAARRLADPRTGARGQDFRGLRSGPVGPTEQTCAALKKGDISLYGEYQGTLLTFLKGDAERRRSGRGGRPGDEGGRPTRSSCRPRRRGRLATRSTSPRQRSRSTTSRRSPT